MTELERKALLGDKEAQEECTEKGIVLPCPCCGGKGKVSFKDYRFLGKNYMGDKKIIYRVQIICNRCKSRGKPIFTNALINPNPYITKWGNCYYEQSDVCRKETEAFYEYVKSAIFAWNTRPEPPVGRCRGCKWFADNNNGEWYGCQMFHVVMATPEDAPKPDDYCSYFEPKESEENETGRLGPI